MGVWKMFLTLFSLFGKKKGKKEEKLETIEEMRFQDAVRREKKRKEKDEMNQDFAEKMNKDFAEKMNQDSAEKMNQGPSRTITLNSEDQGTVEKNPYEKVARMLRTETRRQQIILAKEKWEKAERKVKEESMRFVEEMWRETEKRAKKERQSVHQKNELIRREAREEYQRSRKRPRSESEEKRVIFRREERVLPNIPEEETITICLKVEEEGPFVIRHRVTFLK